MNSASSVFISPTTMSTTSKSLVVALHESKRPTSDQAVSA